MIAALTLIGIPLLGGRCPVCIPGVKSSSKLEKINVRSMNTAAFGGAPWRLLAACCEPTAPVPRICNRESLCAWRNNGRRWDLNRASAGPAAPRGRNDCSAILRNDVDRFGRCLRSVTGGIDCWRAGATFGRCGNGAEGGGDRRRSDLGGLGGGDGPTGEGAADTTGLPPQAA